VLNGSKGPVFYSAEQNKKSSHLWNSIPLTVNHPTKDNQYISAKAPGVLDSVGIGELRNPHTNSSGVLKAEAWVEVTRVKAVDLNLYNRINSGQPIEVSTGLMADTQKLPQPQEHFNGLLSIPYQLVAENYQPDHLAVLTNEPGACSLVDGCGLNVNANNPNNEEGGQVLELQIWNALSFREVTNELYKLLRERFGTNLNTFDPSDEIWIQEVFPKKVIFEGKINGVQGSYQIPFSVSKNTVKLGDGQPTQVQKEISYKPLRNEANDPVINQNPTEDTMPTITDPTQQPTPQNQGQTQSQGGGLTRQLVVNQILANCPGWAGQESFLQNADEATLGAIIASSQAPSAPQNQPAQVVPTPPQAQTPPPVQLPTGTLTTEEWMIQAPNEVKQVFVNAKALQDAERIRIINSLLSQHDQADTQGIANRRTFLEGQTLETLQGMEAMFASVGIPPQQAQQPTVNYSGQAAPATPTQMDPVINRGRDDVDQNDFLDLPEAI